MMQAGKLKHRIQIEEPVVVGKSPMNADIVEYTPYLVTWSRIRPIRGREYLEGKMEQADATAEILFRAQAGKTVTPDMRVVFGKRIYEIVSPPVDVNELGKEVQLMCREIYGQSDIC